MEKKKILVIDDEPLVRNAARRFLQYDGYDVDVCATSNEAVVLAATNTYALVLSDVMLDAGDSGIEVVKGLRAAGHLMPIVLMSGELGRYKAAAESLTQSGEVSCLVQKPWDNEMMMTLIAQLAQ